MRWNCRLLLKQSLRNPQLGGQPLGRRGFSNSSVVLLSHKQEPSSHTLGQQTQQGAVDVDKVLSKPTWSVSSLLASNSNPSGIEAEITPARLHHLLRLSALPPPSSAEEESQMLQTLHNQLRFVRQIQSIDTTGVEPLRALRDESSEAEQESEITLESMRTAFEKEEKVGKFWKRPIRQKPGTIQIEAKNGISEGIEQKWDPLENVNKKVGRFFVVDKGNKKRDEGI